MALHCPVCGEEFPSETTSELRFQRHVNRCLDGEPDHEGMPASQQQPHLLPQPESQVSLSSSFDVSSPVGGTQATAPPGREAQDRSGDSSVNGAHLAAGGALHHVPSSSLEFYAAIEENVEFICGLCPEFPRSLVEEVLVSNGNDKAAAMSMLFDLKEQSDSVLHGPSSGGSAGTSRQRHNHHHHDHQLRRSSLESFGVTSHLSRDGHNGSAPSHAGPLPTSQPSTTTSTVSSSVELVIYDLQPDSTVAKKVGLGAYHTGVVLYRHEFSFGGTRNPKRDAGKSGIWATRHLYATAPVVKKRVTIGTTYWTIKEVQALLKEWGRTTWRVDDYHLLSKNCNHFAEALLQTLADRSVVAAAVAAGGGSGGSFVAPVPAPALATTSIRTPASPAAASAATTAGSSTATNSVKVNVPAGASPLPGMPTATIGLEVPPPRTVVAVAVPTMPTFPLPPDEAKKVREAFQLPSWVNRAASLGNAVVPDFLFKKIVEALMPPVPEDDDISSSDVDATPTSTR